MAGDYAATTLVRAFVPDGVVLPESQLAVFGARDLFDESEVAVVAKPLKSKSKMGTFLSDFRDLAVGDYVVHVEHGIAQYQGLREIAQADGSAAEFMVLEYAEAARLYRRNLFVFVMTGCIALAPFAALGLWSGTRMAPSPQMQRAMRTSMRALPAWRTRTAHVGRYGARRPASGRGRSMRSRA